MTNRNSDGKFAPGNTMAQNLPRNNSGKFVSPRSLQGNGGTSNPVLVSNSPTFTVRVNSTTNAYSVTPSPVSASKDTVMISNPNPANFIGIDVPDYTLTENSRETAYGRHTRIITQEYSIDKKDGNGPIDGYREYLQVLKMAACVLPICLDSNGNPNYMLIRQFRYPAYYNAKKQGSASTPEQDGWLYEAIAGVVDKGNTPEQTAIIEAGEEGNVVIEPANLRKVHHCFMTPGLTNEEMSMFLAVTSKGDTVNGSVSNTGLASEGEFIKAKWMTRDEIRVLAAKGLIRDAKTLILLYAAKVL